MKFPEFLKQGSKIIILSPAGAINPDYVKSTESYLKELGFEPIISKSCLNRHFQYGGTDAERLADLQAALDDKSIDAILCSRGGYGLIHLLDKLNFSGFQEKPKWIIGFSDITNIHLAINKLGIASLHSQMAKAIHTDKESQAVVNIFDILKGNIPEYKIEPHNLNRKGISTGELIGGNLSILYSLQATDFEIDCNNKILFIEDLNEYLYHIDRMMTNLKLSGKLKNLKALIVGGFTDMKDNANPFGQTAYEIIKEKVAEYNYPLCFNFPCGHIDNNVPLIEGGNYEINISGKECILRSIK